MFLNCYYHLTASLLQQICNLSYISMFSPTEELIWKFNWQLKALNVHFHKNHDESKALLKHTNEAQQTAF